MFGRWVVGLATGLAVTTAMQAQARTVAEIMQSGTLRACVPTANPPDGIPIPEGCTGNCQYEGVIGDLVETFAKSLDLEPEYWVSSWDGLFHNADGVTVREDSYTPALLAENQCDMFGAVMVSLDWRRTKIEMECFLPSRMMVVTHRDRVGEFTDVSDLGGRTVSVERSMSMHSWIQDQNAGPLADNPIEVVFHPYDQSVPSVDSGKVDFTVVSVLDALWQTRNITENAQVAFAVGPVDMGCWGYERGDGEMGELIEAFFDEQTADPASDLNEVWERYFGLSYGDFIRLVSTIE